MKTRQCIAFLALSIAILGLSGCNLINKYKTTSKATTTEAVVTSGTKDNSTTAAPTTVTKENQTTAKEPTTIATTIVPTTVAPTSVAPTTTVAPKVLTSIEVKIDEEFEYVRTMDISEYVLYRTAYSDGSKGYWLSIEKENLSEVKISGNKITAKVSIEIEGNTYEAQAESEFTESCISVSELLKKEASTTAYVVEGVIAGFSTTMGHSEIILQDTVTNEFIGVDGCLDGTVYKYELISRGFEVGDTIRIPVVAVEASEDSQVSDSLKKYASYKGGSDYASAVISKGSSIRIDKENAVTISSQAELVEFLKSENRSSNAYKLVRLHGEVSYVYYSGSSAYRFFFGSAITSLAEQKVDNCSPVFTDANTYYSTGKTASELIFGQKDVQNSSWSTPEKATQEVYALFIGGNTYYHQFVILTEDSIDEVEPFLIGKEFSVPTKTSYLLNEAFTIEGAKITYKYDYKEDVVIDVTMAMIDEATIPNMSKASDSITVKGSYEGYDFSFDIKIVDATPKSIALKSELESKDFRITGSSDDIINALLGKEITVEYASKSETVEITSNMLTIEEGWAIGEKKVTITYLGLTTDITVSIKNLALSVSEFKKLEASTDAVEVSGIVVSAVYISGTTANPANHEVLIMDKTTGEVVGVKGLATTESVLAGLKNGDEVIFTVIPKVTSTGSVSEKGKIAAYVTADNKSYVLSSGNAYALDKASAVTITNQEELQAFLAADARVANAYKLVKLTNGIKFVAYSGGKSFFITYATSSADMKVDGLSPFIHDMNNAVTLGETKYADLLFPSGNFTTSYTSEDAIYNGEVYVLYVGGQGAYYHQFVILDASYVEEAVITKVEMKSAPTKKSYMMGETLDVSGGILTLTFKSGTTKEIPVEGSMAEAVDLTTAGTKTVKITYSGVEMTYEVTVEALSVTSISVATAPTKTTFDLRDSIDLSGAELTVKYNDGTSETVAVTIDMYDATTPRSLGEKTIKVTYGGLETTINVTIDTSALTISEFLKLEAGATADIRVIVVGPVSSYNYAELLVKEKDSDVSMGIMDTGIVGSYNALKLDETIVKAGDEIVIKVTKDVSTTNVNVNKCFARANKDTLKDDIVTLSSNNEIKWSLTKVTTISTEEELVAFINSEERFYSIVKLVGVRGIAYKDGYRIFFGTSVTNLAGQKVTINEIASSPYLDPTNAAWYLDSKLSTYFDNASSTSYSAPATTTYDIYCMFTGGNSYYHVFAVLGADWFVAQSE